MFAPQFLLECVPAKAIESANEAEYEAMISLTPGTPTAPKSMPDVHECELRLDAK